MSVQAAADLPACLSRRPLTCRHVCPGDEGCAAQIGHWLEHLGASSPLLLQGVRGAEVSIREHHVEQGVLPGEIAQLLSRCASGRYTGTGGSTHSGARELPWCTCMVLWYCRRWTRGQVSLHGSCPGARA